MEDRVWLVRLLYGRIIRLKRFRLLVFRAWDANVARCRLSLAAVGPELPPVLWRQKDLGQFLGASTGKLCIV